MRQIILDTETTGLSPESGHRIIEIGCLEMINRRLTGERFHVYINPEREIEFGATQVHGISTEFLQDKPLFANIIDDFISFIDQSELIIHNAPFDVGFLNHEFKLAGKKKYKTIADYASVFDTLPYARKKHPGQKNNLDALCKRYSVDNSGRDLHGALLDAELLAGVYLMMTGGQESLFGEIKSHIQKTDESISVQINTNTIKNLPVIAASDKELIAHKKQLNTIKNVNSGSCIWENSKNV